MNNKLSLFKNLNTILSIQIMPIHEDLTPMKNSSNVEIKKFIMWPVGVDFVEYDVKQIFNKSTIPQTKLTADHWNFGNFEILHYLANDIIEKYSFEKYIQLYEEHKNVLERLN